MPRTPSKAGSVAIKIDLRSSDVSGKEAHWTTNLDELMVLLALLLELAGPAANVLFDFGVITISDVNLTDLKARFEKPSDPS